MKIIASMLSVALAVGVLSLGGLGALPASAETSLFGPSTFYDVGDLASSVTVEDFNGDGNSDLAVTSRLYQADTDGRTGCLSILVGDGAGAFTPGPEYSLLHGIEQIASGDFNEDGHVDLAVTLSGIWLGAGDGSFTRPATPAPVVSGTYLGIPSAIVVTDIDQDSHLDLVIAFGPEALSAGLTVRLGDGTGAFAPERPLAAGSNPRSIAVADLDRDGDLDLAVATSLYEDSRLFSAVTVFVGDGSGAFASASTLLRGSAPTEDYLYGAVSASVGDFDGDGTADLAVGDWHGNLAVLLGDKAGGFAPPTTLEVRSGANAVADVDGDGNLDLVVDGGVVLGNGHGGFGPLIEVSHFAGVAVADLDHDQRPDLVSYGGFFVPDLPTLSVRLNTAPPPNTPPDCSGVVASPATLAPAARDHMKMVGLGGATDPDAGNTPSYTITGVTQDEYVTGAGDDTAPDADTAGTEPNQVRVRSERNPKGNGRVYGIAYTVTDGTATCSGHAIVSVPRKPGGPAIDDGDTHRWDSFTGAPL